MPKEAKRRFQAVDVEEISLVGTPANETPFYVVKNKKTENPDMAAKATNGGTETVSLASAPPSDDAVAKCLASVSSIVNNVALLAKGQPAQTQTETTKGEEKSNEAETDPTVALLTKAGLTKEAAASTVETLKKAGIALSSVVTQTTTKSEKTEEESENELAELVAGSISKAARFTPARMSQLKNAYEALKLVIEGVEQGAAPATKTPKGTSPGSGIGSQIAKGEDGGSLVAAVTQLAEAVQKSMEINTTKTKELADRLEAIEKAKPASDSEGSGTTEEKTTKSKSLFAGLV